MTQKTFVFHIAAAIAFLTATPMLAGSTATVFMPNLQFVEDTAHPNRAATQDFLTCHDAAKGDTAAERACEVAIKDVLTEKRSAEK